MPFSIRRQVVFAYLGLAAIIFAIVAAAVLGGRAFVRANTVALGELRESSLAVERGGAVAVDAEITLGFDEMTLRGGADELMELDFATNFAEDPIVIYEVDSGLGDLIVEPHGAIGIPANAPMGEYRNQWDLRLNSETPMDLTVILGAGLGTLDLRGMTLTSLTVELGAGEAVVDLRGEWAQGFDVLIEAGVGEVTVYLPSETGVHATVERAIGAVNVSGLEKIDGASVNEAYGRSDVTLNIEVEAGIGEVNLEVPDGEEGQ